MRTNSLACLRYALILMGLSLWGCVLDRHVEAQTVERRFWYLVHHDARDAIQTGGDLLRSPGGYDASRWAMIGGIGVLTAVSVSVLDEPIRDAMSSYRTPLLDVLSPFGDFYGMPYTALGISGTLYLSGYATSSESLRITGRAVFESAVYATLFTSVLKILFSRSRPYREDGPHTLNWVEWDDSQWSFPSGHTTIAFAVSSSLSDRIGNPLAGIALYGAALLTVFNRLYDDKHWFSDTLIGAVIGTVVGLAVSRRLTLRHAPSEQANERNTFSIPLYQFHFHF